MTTEEIIKNARNGQCTAEEIRNIENLNTWEEIQPLLIMVGKSMRELATERESFITNNIMKEVENCYSAALHADSAYMMFVKLQEAIAWLNKGGKFVSTGIFE